MTYDNTKFQAAMEAWLVARCDEGFGETYAGDLLEDFENWLVNTSALRSSPGHVVFGMELARLGFEKRRKMGLTFWGGVLLRNSPDLSHWRWSKNMIKFAKKRLQERRVQRKMERF